MIWNLLDEAATPSNNYIWFFVIAIIVIFAIYLVFSNRKSKQRQKEYTEQLDAISPGHKVKTIGGICGVVVEVCDDNTVIIETGTEASGKSYVKMDKECIAQTDAKGPTQIAREKAEAAKAAEKKAKKEGKPVEKPEEPAASEESETVESKEDEPSEQK